MLKIVDQIELETSLKNISSIEARFKELRGLFLTYLLARVETYHFGIETFKIINKFWDF